MQISDSSSRILAGLLEARTGQQLTMSGVGGSRPRSPR